VPVAPSARAASSFAATRSTTTIVPAPARAAPMTHDNPTPPSPMTTTLAPGWTAPVFVIAPTPVVTQQPISAATAWGVVGSTGIAAAAGTFWRSADVAVAE